MPSMLRLKPPSVKSLQPGDSEPVSLVVVRQVGNMVKKHPWLGQKEGLRHDLMRLETQAHRLKGVSPRRAQGSHHFDSSICKLAEVGPLLVPCRL